MKPARVAIIGVDCLTPQLLFERYADVLPNFARLRAQGPWGTLTSTAPPITVPAWMCMATGVDPGVLGVYGFRNRVDRSYSRLAVADASWVKVPALWQLLSRKHRPSIVLGVPLTWPPRPINGALVSGIPIPEDAEVITAPPELRGELDSCCGDGGYLSDVSEFRDQKPDELLQKLMLLMHTRFDAAEHLVASRPWELFFMVEMSIDRLHHALWAHCHEEHPQFVPDSPYRNAIRDAYVAIDGRIGRLLEKLGDDVHVLVVSDHGARTMMGGLRVNEWLIENGYLTLMQRPLKTRRLSAGDIDWSHTRAWADGGYYGRIFFNVKGREPEGTVNADRVTELRAELTARLEQMPGPDGAPLGNRVFAPNDIYRETNGVPPDLILYPANLAYRANATVLPEEGPRPGESALFAIENDTGVDGANHSEDGIVMFRPASGNAVTAAPGVASIYDIAPTVLALLGEAVPAQMKGRVVNFQ